MNFNEGLELLRKGKTVYQEKYGKKGIYLYWADPEEIRLDLATHQLNINMVFPANHSITNRKTEMRFLLFPNNSIKGSFIYPTLKEYYNMLFRDDWY